MPTAAALVSAARCGCTREARERPLVNLLPNAGGSAAGAGCLHQSTWPTRQHAAGRPSDVRRHSPSRRFLIEMSFCVIVVPKKTAVISKRKEEVVVRGALHAGTNGASTPLFNTCMTHSPHLTLVRWGKSHLFSAETSHEPSRCRRWRRSYYGARVASKPGARVRASQQKGVDACPRRISRLVNIREPPTSPSSLIIDDSPRTSRYFVPEPTREVVRLRTRTWCM